MVSTVNLHLYNKVDGSYVALAYNRDGAASSTQRYIRGNKRVTDGKWHHVCFTVTSEFGAKTYVDAKEDKSLDWPIGFMDRFQRLEILVGRCRLNTSG